MLSLFNTSSKWASPRLFEFFFMSTILSTSPCEISTSSSWTLSPACQDHFEFISCALQGSSKSRTATNFISQLSAPASKSLTKLLNASGKGGTPAKCCQEGPGGGGEGVLYGSSVSKQEFLPKCFFSNSCTPPFWQFHPDYYFQTAMCFS